MEEPDWSVVSEEELWKFVGWHLANKGIQSILVVVLLFQYILVVLIVLVT
jgi:hypothetical protein